MLTKFTLLLSVLAVAASTASGDESAELETIYDVNSYLLNAGLELEPLGRDERLSERQLNQMEAIKLKLDRVRQEIASMDGRELLEMASVCESYRTLLGGKADARPLIAFLDSLTQADCDQVSLDFLMIVANFKVNDAGQKLHHLLVQNYAKLRVQQCWLHFVDSVSKNLERALGKMAAPLFGFIDKLALRMKWESKKHSVLMSRSHTFVRNIKIDGDPAKEKLVNFSDVSSGIDLDEPADVQTIIAALKEIQLDTFAQRKSFAQGLGKLQGDYRESLAYEDRIPSLSLKLESFYEELFRQPCKELIERVRSVMTPGDIFKGHITRTLGRTLAEEKEHNTRLDYHLQVYRICKLTSEHDADIRRHLSYVR